MRRICLIAVAAIACQPIAAAAAYAQDRASIAWSVARQITFDPTTYAPAIISHTAERLDWKSSQVFFQHGYVERNPQFTISGRPDDVPIGYGAGNRIILGNALKDLGSSAINNAGVAVVERLLLARFPNHPKLIRRLGWAERIAFAASLASVQSATHFRQWRENERLARELGYR
jgi:hypothetical protein